MTIETDYLVKGCGAMAMAFVDTMLAETDATFTIVDKRDAPGGHWNDSYSFVRLHQPSANYGVASRPLGHDRKDTEGFNKGLYELASGIEVTDHMHQTMRDVFLPSGRVKYFPMCEVVGDETGPTSEFVHLLTGERHTVNIRKKRVDGTMVDTLVPARHKRKFEVDDGVACVIPNDLPRQAANHKAFVVLGAGKTAMDCVIWLLSNGVKPDAITWVRPRDAWMLSRENFQPGPENAVRGVDSQARLYEAAAGASDVDDLALKMEADGGWLRIDTDVWPTMWHAATVTLAELEAMRSIRNVVRKGRVQRVTKDKLILEQGEAPIGPGALIIDCTARSLSKNVNNWAPIFEPDLIRLQMIRPYQPTFSAALLGFIEANVESDEEKQAYTKVTPMLDRAEDFPAVMCNGIQNQGAWSSNPNIVEWLCGCRLDIFTRYVVGAGEADTELMSAVARLATAAPAAAQNLGRMAMEQAKS